MKLFLSFIVYFIVDIIKEGKTLKHRKKFIGLVIFTMLIGLLLVNPIIYTDFFRGYQIERHIRRGKIESHHFEIFGEMSTERANKIILEHGDKLLALGFYKEVIDLEDLNQNDKLNYLIAEAYYQNWIHTSIEEPYRGEAYLFYADKLVGGKVDKYFMPLYIRRPWSGGALYERKNYVTDDYKSVYNELLAKEIENAIVNLLNSHVIYSQDAHLWWVPEGIDIIQQKDLAIKTFLKELETVNKDCFNRTIFYLVNNVTEMQEYLEELDIYKYYDEPVKNLDFIHGDGQLLKIDGVPRLYIQGEKYNDELGKHQIGYFKINLDTKESDFYQSNSQVTWREDGQYSFSKDERLIFDENNTTHFMVEVDIAIYDKNLHLVESFIIEIENMARIYWKENELFIDDFDVRKVFRPETRKLEENIPIRGESTLGSPFYELMISTSRYSKGFAYYSEEGTLVYETDKIVITDSVLVKDNRIIYQTLNDIGIFIFSIEEEKLDYIDTTSKFVSAADDHFIVLKFEDDYLSVLAKMDLSGKIVETYPFYNNSEVIESKGTKLLKLRTQYGTN